MNVIIIGAGSTASNVVEILRQNRVFEVVGLIDISMSDKEIDGIKVIGTHSILSDLYGKDGIVNVIIAIGDNLIREKHFFKLRQIGYNFVNAIHNSAIISENVKLGEGVIIEAGVIIERDAVIGDNVYISSGTMIKTKAAIGNNVYLGPGVIVDGETIIKKNCRINGRAYITNRAVVGKNAVVPVGKIIEKNIKDISRKE